MPPAAPAAAKQAELSHPGHTDEDQAQQAVAVGDGRHGATSHQHSHPLDVRLAARRQREERVTADGEL